LKILVALCSRTTATKSGISLNDNPPKNSCYWIKWTDWICSDSKVTIKD
jgi:hypothetical protein